jgi:hypothetical protein
MTYHQEITFLIRHETLVKKGSRVIKRDDLDTSRVKDIQGRVRQVCRIVR